MEDTSIHLRLSSPSCVSHHAHTIWGSVLWPAVKWPEHEGHHSHLSVAEVKNASSFIFIHCTSYVHGVMVKHVGGNISLIPYPPPS
jgi:hypothetical protein